MKLRNLVSTLLLFSATAVWAQYQPPAGGEALYELYSPRSAASRGSVTSTDSPIADSLNPAASGGTQRVTLDLSYLGLTGFGSPEDNEGWQGHAVNLGGSFPTRAGVITGSLHFLRSGLAAVPLGTTFGANLSFAKDLFPDLYVGAGLDLLMGGEEGVFDFGVTGDLGVLYFPARFYNLENARWGIVMRDMGAWYTPVAGQSPVPSPFTPALGLGFEPITTDDLVLDVTSEVSFPSFQNVRVNLGLDLSLFDTVNVTTGWGIDLRETIDQQISNRSLLPSFGLSVDFTTNFEENDSFISEQGWNQSEVRTRASAAPLYDGTWSFGAGANIPLGVVDTTPPEVELTYPEVEYISPNNDGNFDALSFPLAITDERYVMSYRLIVENEDGQTVREIQNKEDRPENEGIRNIIDRLLAVDSGIPVPDTLRWDGTTDEGAVASDGRYRFFVESTDDNGNVGRSEIQELVIDTQPPSISIERPSSDERIFSPNDDGNKDSLTISQDGSQEDSWRGQILAGGDRVVRAFEWSAGAPESFTWDGTNSEGILVPDGVYRYRVTSTDRAGNTTTETLENIIVNTQSTPIGLAIDSSVFSPNGDGVLDRLELTPDVPIQTGVEEWSLSIRTTDGNAVRTYRGEASVPEPIAFDGRNEAGEVIAEGEYRARLSMRYRNGNTPEASSPQFRVDLTAPEASVRADNEIFSPNNDGNLDSMVIFQDTSEEDRWVGRIRNSDGELVRSYTWFGTPERRFDWNGRNGEGELVSDGTYSYEIEATDAAGNTGSSQRIRFELSTAETPVIITAAEDAFSPNSDGVRDQLRILPQVRVNEGIERYQLDIVNAEGSLVRSFSGEERLPGQFTWNGQTQAGTRVPDGVYRARLDVRYRNGNEENARTGEFRVDTEYPQAEIEASPLLFSPNGDGNRDVVRIIQTSTEEELWEAAILNASEEMVRSYVFQGELESFEWDGTDEAGNQVADGSYAYRVTSTDAAGNRTEEELTGIEIDTRPTSVFVTLGQPAFSPNDDGFRDSVEIGMLTNLVDGSERWELRFEHEDGRIVHSVGGEDVSESMNYVWNGRGDDGNVVEGIYRAVFEVWYEKGNRPTAESGELLIDITPPRVELTLTPKPFSPDNDGVDDELMIRISQEDASSIREWELVILDRNNRFFNSFSGQSAPPAELIWDGRASDGELVISAEDYPVELTMTDSLGNTATAEDVIPVDVLVVRDGDDLRVQIPSITFEPNSPNLVLDPEDELGARNVSILNRLVEVFTKYDAYNIRIEGHAVNVTGTDREEREELQPLSLSRAQTVENALVELGLAERRITVEGRGGLDPIVPHTNLEERWKNRRVEFILIR